MNKVKTKIGDALVQVIAVMIGLILIFPIVYCVCSAFKTPGEFALSKLLPESFTYLANFKNALHQAPLMRYMLNSVIVSLLGTVMRLYSPYLRHMHSPITNSNLRMPASF